VMTLNWKKCCLFSPSLICFDLCNLERDVHLLDASGIELLHVDILDGHFSPSMPLGLETVRQLRQKTKLQFDVHLMATVNEYFVDELLDIGVQQLIFHIETEPHVDNLLNKIKSRNVRAGVALKPGTPVSVLDCVLEKCDTVLLMLINPGYAWNKSETQVSYADRKIRELRGMIDNRNLETAIEIDGRISMKNIGDYGKSVVDIFVAGSTCISRNTIAENVGKLIALRESVVKSA
jgi:ribulose-phosphate 3-epimerase